MAPKPTPPQSNEGNCILRGHPSAGHRVKPDRQRLDEAHLLDRQVGGVKLLGRHHHIFGQVFPFGYWLSDRHGFSGLFDDECFHDCGSFSVLLRQAVDVPRSLSENPVKFGV
jgi:hypothetical protein